MASFARPTRKRGRTAPSRDVPGRTSAGTAPTPGGRDGYVVGVFGATKVGVSTLLRVLTKSAHTDIVALDWNPLALDGIKHNLKQGVQVVFIDLGQAYDSDVQALYDNRFVGPGSGALIHIDCAEISLPEDGRRMRAEWRQAMLPSVEKRAQILGMPYFVVRNERGEEGALTALADLARRAGVRD